MSAKPRNKASMDAAAVARMMAEQDQDEAAPTAAASEPEPASAAAPAHPPSPAVAEARSILEFDPGKVDGRTLRRTGREPFATRIKPETHASLRRIAYNRGITIAEAVEMAVAAYEAR